MMEYSINLLSAPRRRVGALALNVECLRDLALVGCNVQTTRSKAGEL